MDCDILIHTNVMCGAIHSFIAHVFFFINVKLGVVVILRFYLVWHCSRIMNTKKSAPSPNTFRARSSARKILKILQLFERVDDLPSDDEHAIVKTRKMKLSPLKQLTSDSVNKSIMLERIPPPFRLYDHSNPIESYTDSEFVNQYNFDKKTTLFIFGLIEYGLLRSSNRGHPVAPLIQLLVTLRFLSTGKYRSKVFSLDFTYE